MNRRSFLSHAAVGALATCRLRAAPGARRPVVLLRGSWQTVNIGDIGHTPGALDLFARYFPEARVILWPMELRRGARELLLSRYPHVAHAEGGLDARGLPDTPALRDAWRDADIMMHGSGSGFGARRDLKAWHEATGKPYGAFGVSTDPITGLTPGRDPEGGTIDGLRERIARLPKDHLDAEQRGIIDRADFMFCRDTLSRDYLATQAVKTPLLEFGPDAQFGMTLRDDTRADAFLNASGLAGGEFVAVIPRLRWTPYYALNNVPRVPTDDIRDAINARTTKADHAALRDFIVRWVRETGGKVLACAEVTYQIDLAKEQLVDPLPADVKSKVVWRSTFWLPDEAASVYARARALVSMDCHSPIISLANGTPMLHLRQPTDTIKAQMFRDIGVPDWLFEVEQTSGEDLWRAVERIRGDPHAARRRVDAAMAEVTRRQKRMLEVVRATAERAAGRTTAA